MNGIALLTVGRDIAPTRVLLTSRIDQGLPMTAVVKLSGLERDAFDQHVANLCTSFKVAPIRGAILDDFFIATSGSPLFAASVVRLVKIGENLHTVVETWRGQDGEDVRRFAFGREVSRLDSAQGRLLYAVLLLGETSVDDLAEILDVTPRIVRERISELQAYHLIATGTQGSGAGVVFAPDDLVSIVEIVRSHLGTTAQAIEAACARAQERSNTSSTTIGVGIRSVLNAWNTGRTSEAVVTAQDIKKRFPKNGDVASIFGAALLRTSPPKYREADRELEEALRLGCRRPELLPNLIQVKTALEDWTGLHELTRSLTSNEVTRDVPLSGFILASQKLVALAKIRINDQRVADLSIEVVERISRKIARLRLDPAFFNILSKDQAYFAREYIAALQRTSPRGADKLRIFEGLARLAEADVIFSDLVRIGLSALLLWWADVENYPVSGVDVISLLARQLRRLERMRKQFETYKTPSSTILSEISRVIHDLEYRGAKFAGQA